MRAMIRIDRIQDVAFRKLTLVGRVPKLRS